MAELDLPTGNTGGEQHLTKFLATLTQLVDVLGKAGPGGDGGEGGSSSPAASKPDNTGKALVGATRKLFNDVANAFRPLKSVLASFSKLQATPQPAGNMALPAPTAPPESPAAAPAPAPESPSIHDAKYDKYFKPDQFAAFRKTDAPAPTAPPVPSAPTAPESGTGPRVIQVQDASVGIEQATVKMNGGTAAAPKAAKPAPKEASASPATEAAPTPSSAFTITTATFSVGQGLFQGQLMLPPELKLTAQQVHVYGQQNDQQSAAASSPASSAAPESPKAEKKRFPTLKEQLALPSISKGVLEALSRLGRGLQESASILATSALQAGKSLVDKVGSGVAAPFKQTGSMIEGVGGRLANAFANPMAAFKDLSGLVMNFVQAVNPGAILGFTMAMRDATAVIGQALAPVMTIATEVVREWANTLAPIARQLAPVLAEVARAFGDMFMAQIRTFATIMQVLMPIIKAMYAVFSGLARIIAAISEGLMVIISGFMGSFDGFDDMVRKVVDEIVDFAKQIVRATVAVVAMVAKMVGATGFLENMRMAAEKKGPDKEDTTGRGAPTGANFTAAESFGKSIATASFTATSAATAPKKTDDFLDQIAKDMDMIANVDMKQVIIEAIESSAPAIARAIAGGAKETLKAAGNAAYEWNPLKGAGEWLGDKAAGLMGY